MRVWGRTGPTPHPHQNDFFPLCFDSHGGHGFMTAVIPYC